MAKPINVNKEALRLANRRYYCKAEYFILKDLRSSGICYKVGEPIKRMSKLQAKRHFRANRIGTAEVFEVKFNCTPQAYQIKPVEVEVIEHTTDEVELILDEAYELHEAFLKTEESEKSGEGENEAEAPLVKETAETAE